MMRYVSPALLMFGSTFLWLVEDMLLDRSTQISGTYLCALIAGYVIGTLWWIVQATEPGPIPWRDGPMLWIAVLPPICLMASCYFGVDRDDEGAAMAFGIFAEMFLAVSLLCLIGTVVLTFRRRMLQDQAKADPTRVDQ